MPGLSGSALATQLKKERPNVPVLYTSGYTKNIMLGAGFEQGLALLGKPFLPADLLSKVDEILAATGE
jgi:DNA-binding response OmpR family regulator